MTNDIPAPELKPEPMPAALLAGLFPSGIVVIAEEFEQDYVAETTQVAEKSVVSQIPAIQNPVTEGALPPLPEVPPAAALSWLGNFGRKVLVVVKDPTALHLNDAHFELLGKILASVKLSMADIALVNAASHKLEYYALNEKLPATVALYFGIMPVDIGAPLKFPYFQVQNWNHTTFVYAPSLTELSQPTPEAAGLKRELWEALKKIFL
jgi:hypothetical protein